jgi:hypothetical protein
MDRLRVIKNPKFATETRNACRDTPRRTTGVRSPFAQASSQDSDVAQEDEERRVLGVFLWEGVLGSESPRQNGWVYDGEVKVQEPLVRGPLADEAHH